MAPVHRPVMIGHGVEAVAAIVPRLLGLGHHVRPEIEVSERKLHGGVLLLEPAPGVAESIQVDDDDEGQLGYVELLEALARQLAARALPARDLLAAGVPPHAVLAVEEERLLLSLFPFFPPSSFARELKTKGDFTI